MLTKRETEILSSCVYSLVTVAAVVKRVTQKPGQWTQYLSSESFGAGFGSALATIDANGDGRDDLLVGLGPTDGTTHLRPLIMI